MQHFGTLYSQENEEEDENSMQKMLEHIQNNISTQIMVVGLPKVFPLDGVCKGCVLGNHHQAPFDSGKAR
jgi:hypothetical protein